jgi:hypothetical protein
MGFTRKFQNGPISNLGEYLKEERFLARPVNNSVARLIDLSGNKLNSSSVLIGFFLKEYYLNIF